MESDHKFPYGIISVPYAMILALATLWFLVVIPPHAADIPIRFNFSNQPEWYVHRISFVVLFLLTEVVVSASILLTAHYWDKRLDHLKMEIGQSDSESANHIESYRRSKNTTSLVNLFFYFLIILTLYNYSLFYYQLKQYIHPLQIAMIALAVIIVDLIITLYIIRKREKEIAAPVRESLRQRHPDMNSEHWIFGIIYYNKDDSRFWVPKRSGLGWTINHARVGLTIFAYAVFFALVALLIQYKA